MNVTVLTHDLRRALKAVAPHADPEKDFPQLHRLRLEVGPEYMTVSATQRYTVAHARVQVLDNGDGELDLFDLSPTDAKEILALFRGKARDGDDQPDASLRLEVDDEHVTVTDVSGMFAGKALTLPRYPTEENFPDVPKLIATKIEHGSGATERLITSGKLLALFTKATQAYEQPLVIDPAGETGTMLISCGDAFIGMLMPHRPDEAKTNEIFGWHMAWLEHISERAGRLVTT